MLSLKTNILNASRYDFTSAWHSNDYFEIADLDIAHCRISLAAPEIFNNNSSKIRVATKYPKFSSDFLATKGIQAETIYLNGSIEIAPSLGLCDAIIDLVATGKTLKENGLKEVEVIKDITSRLIVNKAALKTKNSIADELTNCLLRNWCSYFQRDLRHLNNLLNLSLFYPLF